MPTSYNTGYNPPQSVVPYPNPDVIITKATPIADELQRSASVSTQDQLALILAQQHKVYSEYLHQWCDWYNWYTGEYIQQYIYKHVREHESHYKQRQERAYYFNYVDSIISLIGSFLYSRAITRSFTRESPEESEAQDEEQTAFWNDIDLRGTNINDFMRRVFNFTKIFGYVDVVVDMPLTTEEIITEQDRLNNNMRPYCYVILPFNMINWEVDEYGDFLWVRWKEDIQKMYDPFQLMPINRTTRYTTWTRNEWYIHEVIYSPGQAARALLVDSGEHNLGVVPVVRFYGKKDLVCETMGRSLVAVIGKINIEILNICSLVDSELYQKALNILCMRDPNENSDTTEEGGRNNQQGVEIGSNNVLFYTGDSPPFYLAPASDPGQAMMDWTTKCIEEIYRISTLGNDTGVDQTKSGVAFSYEFNMTNRMLADNADLMQNGEEQVHRLFARWMSTEFDGYVDYPDSFDVGSYRDEIQSLMDAKDIFRSPTLVRELEKKLGRKMLARSSAGVANQIMEEIDTLPEKTTIRSNPFQRQTGDPTSPQQLEREQENRELKQESISGNT